MPELGNKTNQNCQTEIVAMSDLLKQAAIKASHENRLKVGFEPTLNFLNSNGPSNVFSVVLSSQLSDDILSETIIETYCYENRIPYLKTDSAFLRRILNQTKSSRLRHANDLRCILIMMPENWMEYEIALLNLIHESEAKNEPLIIPESSNLREIT